MVDIPPLHPSEIVEAQQRQQRADQERRQYEEQCRAQFAGNDQQAQWRASTPSAHNEQRIKQRDASGAPGLVYKEHYSPVQQQLQVSLPKRAQAGTNG